jgi:TRAP-type C4-dicarboxylate transport system permease small subunit
VLFGASPLFFAAGQGVLMAKAVLRQIERVEELITVFFLFIMCVFVLLQLFSRFILNSPLLFTEEVSRYSYVWITFIGLSLATKTGDHIKVDFFMGLLPRAARVVIERIVNTISFLILLYLCYLGLRFLAFSGMNESAALKIPLNFVYVSLPLGCLLAAFRTARIVLKKGGQ